MTREFENSSSTDCGIQAGREVGSQLEKLVGSKDWTPGGSSKWGQWEGWGDLGGREVMVSEQNVSFSVVGPLQVLRPLRYQTQIPSGAGR